MFSLSPKTQKRLARLHRRWVLYRQAGMDYLWRTLGNAREQIIRRVPGDDPNAASRTLCIFSHFDRNGVVDDYVLHYLDALCAQDCRILFVTTGPGITDRELAKVAPRTREIIVRKNQGMDFCSWKTGMDAVDGLSGYDRLILANDSAYGPLYGLDEVFRAMEGYDLWGITDTWQERYHLQSYFLVFNKNALHSPFFDRFWQAYPCHRIKDLVIRKGEVAMSQAALKQGLTIGAYCEYYAVRDSAADDTFSAKPRRPLPGGYFAWPQNSTHSFWRSLLLEHRCPFLKIELLRENPIQVPGVWEWFRIVRDNTEYDTALILKHLRRIGRGESA